MPCPKLTVAEMGLRPRMVQPCSRSPQTSPSVQGPPSSRSFKPKTPTTKGCTINAADRIHSGHRVHNQQEFAGAITAVGTLIVLSAPALDGPGPPPQAKGAVPAALQVLVAPLSFPTPVTSSHSEITPQSCCGLTAQASPIAAHSSMSPK